MKIYKNITQGSDEWFELKLGKITGTRLSALMGSLTTAVGLKAMDTLFYTILAERDTGLRKEQGETNTMDRGIEEERNSQDYFEIETGFKVEEVGFITSDLPMTGLSPDGAIFGNTGEIFATTEYKNPNSDTHLRYLCQLKGIPSYGELLKGFKNRIPYEYYWQCVHNFVVIDTLETLYFISHDERNKTNKNIMVELRRDDIKEDIAEAKKRIKVFANAVKEAEKLLFINKL